jgi:YesN/AraC family two-component response regulator
MKGCPKTRRKCNYADRRSFEKCEKANSLLLYKCHAGLVEAIMPLHENEKIIGYLMFGQITDNPDKTDLFNKIAIWNETYGIDNAELKSGIDNITYKTDEEIKAAAKIMEACTSFIVYKELIIPDNNKILESVKSYIENHLSENIEIEQLCDKFDVGRTKLYEIFRKEQKMGISKYILRRRLHKAKKLLKTTELTIAEIANNVGFSDYNYFSRIYKKQYGKSPKHYRK